MASVKTRKFKVSYHYGTTIAVQTIINVSTYFAEKGEVQFFDADGKKCDYFTQVITVVEQI